MRRALLLNFSSIGHRRVIGIHVGIAELEFELEAVNKDFLVSDKGFQWNIQKVKKRARTQLHNPGKGRSFAWGKGSGMVWDEAKTDSMADRPGSRATMIEKWS